MKILRNEKAFSLLETVVAMVVLGLSMHGLATLSTAAARMNAGSARLTTATALAREQIEGIKGLNFAGVDAQQGTQEYNTITGYARYKRVTAVTTDPGDANVKTVTVTVYWNSDNKSFALSTIIARPGV